jgi:hypothetical protein
MIYKKDTRAGTEDFHMNIVSQPYTKIDQKSLYFIMEQIFYTEIDIPKEYFNA